MLGWEVGGEGWGLGVDSGMAGGSMGGSSMVGRSGMPFSAFGALSAPAEEISARQNPAPVSSVEVCDGSKLCGVTGGCEVGGYRGK